MKLRSLLASAAASVLLLAGCGASGDNGGTGGGGQDQSHTIGVSFYSRTIPLYVDMQEGMEAAAEKAGVELTFSYANNSAATQSDQINNFITQQVDLILASPVDANALVPAYRQAQTAGIPVISVANKVADKSVEAAYVGPDLVDQARRTMERLIEGIGGSGDVLAITGPPQIAFVQLQKQGWEAAMEDAPDVRIAETLVDPELATAKAVDLTTAGLTSNPNVDAIMCSNDDIALGAVQVVRERGIPDDEIFIAGWDGTDAAVKAIKEGTYDLTLSQKAYTWGEIALGAAVDWLNGKKPAEHRVPTPDLFIDESNVNELTEEELR